MLRHTMGRWQLGGKSFRNSGLLLSMIFSLMFSLAPLARAQDAEPDDGHDSHARIVRLSYVDGAVRLDNGHGYESATMNVPLAEHDWLQTGPDGWAEVQMEDGSIIRLAPDTVIAFTELGRSASGGTITTVDLDQGEAEFKIAKHDDSDFQVTVKKNTLALNRAGTFRVSSTNADPLEVAVWKGEIGVRDAENGGEIAVQKNETFVLNPNDPGQYALDKGADADDLDQWSKQRDDALSTYAAAGQGYAQSPYQYGESDLNYYGQYYDVPGYGEVWQPNNVGYNWDPFSNGYWSYSPGFGYTWVSSYPWGWMPYRYGRWTFISGRGWCWAPGGWNRWNRAPLVANAPPGFHAPIPPADRRVTGGAPGRVNHPDRSVDNGGPGGRFAGSGGGRVADRDGDNNRNPGRPDGNRGNTRVFTNDDTARVPRTDLPAQSPTPATIDIDRKPRIVDQQTSGGAGNRGGDVDHGRENRDQPSREPVRRSNNDTPSNGGSGNRDSATRPERQYTPPPQSYSPPNRQAERENTPTPAPTHQQAAPPPPPVMHQSAPPAAAPAPRQSSPPPESHATSDDGGRGGRPK
jgi:hypothetical protein